MLPPGTKYPYLGIQLVQNVYAFPEIWKPAAYIDHFCSFFTTVFSSFSPQSVPINLPKLPRYRTQKNPCGQHSNRRLYRTNHMLQYKDTDKVFHLLYTTKIKLQNVSTTNNACTHTLHKNSYLILGHWRELLPNKQNYYRKTSQCIIPTSSTWG